MSNERTQRQIVKDLLRRADMLEDSARTAKHRKANRIALQLCARVLRVAALQNSPGYEGPDDHDANEITAD